ncbi:CAP domain-containing protein [Undibacterium sp.]|uniref:CAP domain-containing protein n=1 Tax=Undibacterium sp. TaxID=1914977 RepID=UPI0037528A89
MKPSKFTCALALSLGSLLVGCGGGGGDSPVKIPDTVVKTCTNGGNDYPTCTPPYVAGDLQTSVDKPPYAEGSEDLRAFNYLNDLRSSLGLGKLNYSAELTLSSTNHANYLNTNKLFSHDENSSLPGFTGVGVTQRVRYAGYPSTFATELLASSNTKTGALERLLGSVYHRSVLLSQAMRDVGTYSYKDKDSSAAVLVLNIGYKSNPQRNASDFIMTYPKDGQTNVNLSMCAESPWPFPDIKVEDACTNPRAENGVIVMDMKVGYPVSIAIQDSKDLTITKFEMFEAGSNTPIPSWLTTKTDTTYPVSKHEAFITAKAGLKPLTKYEASFSGLADGIPFTKTWSFTTAASLYSN